MTARIERTTLVKTGAEARARMKTQVERFSAPFSLRCGALLIDYIILVGILVLSTLAARLLGGGAHVAGGTAETLGFIIMVIAALLDFVVLTALRGQTLGKWATGLRIERKDGRPLNWGHSLLRHLLGYPLSLFTLGIGFVLAAFSKRGRALHDLLAGTVVVRNEARRTTRTLG